MGGRSLDGDGEEDGGEGEEEEPPPLAVPDPEPLLRCDTVGERKVLEFKGFIKRLFYTVPQKGLLLKLVAHTISSRQTGI